MRILCVLVVIGFAALALGMALRDPANRSHAQTQHEIQASAAAPARSSSPAAASTASPVSSSGAPAILVASNVGIRTLAVASQPSETPPPHKSRSGHRRLDW